MTETITPDVTQQIVEDDGYFYSNDVLISCAYNAIVCLESYDPMTAEDKARKQRIINHSIEIIDICIEELHQFTITQP